MARSTCNPNVEAPKGMMKFEVIKTTIRDSLGQFCVVGDMAVLDKKAAKGYLDANMIKVMLPEFDEPEDDADDKADDSTTDDSGSEDEAERPETPIAARRRAGKRS